MSMFNIDVELAKVRAQNAAYNQNYDVLSMLHDKGVAFEKHNNIDKAIESFEKCVEFGEQCSTLNIAHYMRDIDRLVILYRKQKCYAKEVAILELALSHGRRDSYALKQKERLVKAKELLAKQK